MVVHLLALVRVWLVVLVVDVLWWPCLRVGVANRLVRIFLAHDRNDDDDDDQQNTARNSQTNVQRCVVDPTRRVTHCTAVRQTFGCLGFCFWCLVFGFCGPNRCIEILVGMYRNQQERTHAN